MIGFFEPSQTAGRTPDLGLLPKCGACGLYRGCVSPKMPSHGDGERRILVLGEAPGADEDEQGVPFVGKAGQFLRLSLDKLGVDLDRDCWVTNSLICRPQKNRKPTSAEIVYCRPNVLKVIRELQPETIILLGGAAIESLLALYWKDAVGSVGTWVGWQIPLQKLNAWVCPNYHPSYVLRSEGKGDEDDGSDKLKSGPVVKLLFEKYLQAAVEHTARPWEKVPDYGGQIRIVTDHNEAARWLRDVAVKGGVVAFDYETNRLKPDFKGAEIVSASVCWKGKETIAFPWIGEAVAAMKELLVSNLPKIGANSKFEDRWTRTVLGVEVKNIVWDTMQGAHVLDNRRGITSVKFQALVRLGLENYATAVEPYLSQSDVKGFNRIRDLDIRTLLRYNGIDSLVEYLIAVDQKKEMETTKFVW